MDLQSNKLQKAFDALAQRNMRLAHQVINRDAALDAFQAKIEEKGINIIAQRQPFAIDLRETISALHISPTSNASATWQRTSASVQLRLEVKCFQCHSFLALNI